MKDISRLQSEDLETLLGWLSEDREQAGTEYIKIRDGLIRFFRYKGCSDSQTLADETINRVAEKVPSLVESQTAKKISIFYGFAVNVFREYLRIEKRQNEKLNRLSIEQKRFAENYSDDDAGSRVECLNECLGKLSPEEKEIFLAYYGQGKEKKSAARRKLAGRLGCEMNTLQVRIFRLRGVLSKCIENCMKKKL